MNNSIDNLPFSENLDIATFSRLLDDTTKSYKFVFLLSLLDLLSSRFFKVSSPIPLRDMAVEMLVNAWYPHSVFRLSFGLQDLVTRNLNELNLELNGPSLKITEGNKKILRDAIKTKTISDELVRYVPFRLIRPFFKELRELKDHQVNIQIKLTANQTFETRKPLYKFDEPGTSIIIHPDWATYIQTNYQIIRGWISWRWLQYMQKKNPNTPALANKLFPPRERELLLPSQTSYWKTVLKNCPDFKCIYSGQTLTLDDLSLDHYLPWSFVAHNQPWNLIPIPKSVNSSKSNRIPHNDYFDRFVRSQHLGLTIFHRSSSEKQWNNHIESFIIDLVFCDQSELLNLNLLARQYEIKIKPLLALAVSQGFEDGWIYQ